MIALASLAAAGSAQGTQAVNVRVTLFGDSAATAMAYDPGAKRILGRGIV